MIHKSEIHSLILYGKLNDVKSDPVCVLKATAQNDPELLLALLMK